MKKGISLIVLVITIIVLAILAGAIIISLSNANIITEANKAVIAADLANAKNTVALAYAEGVANGVDLDKTDGKAYTTAGAKMVATDYTTALTNAGFTATKYAIKGDAAGSSELAEGEVPYVFTK